MRVKKIKTAVRQRQIEKAALTVIGRKGLNGLTISAIAREVGIANGNVYRHFKSKDAVVRALVFGIKKRIEQIVQTAVSENKPPAETLERLFFLHIGFITEYMGVLRVFLADEEFLHSNMLIAARRRAIEKYLSKVKDILRLGVKNGCFYHKLDVDAAAMAFLGLIQSTFIRRILIGNVREPQMTGKNIWQLFLRGIQS